MLLRRYRLDAGLSQEALAERARMSTNGISALERGYRRTPQRETLALLAGALALDDEQREEFEAAAARAVLLGRGASVTVGPWADSTIANLPLALTSFVGRAMELEEIGTLLREHRMVTLTGAGGVGKTQTALRVAAGLRHPGEHAACFVGLARISNPSLVVAAIASALGVQEVPNRSLLETLLAYLKNKSLLLIIDNCEHVITQAAIAAEALLTGSARARILATSREPLRAAGEYSYRLPSLDVPSAIALFADRACAADHRFMLTDQNAAIAGEICRRLDGIPLAIELAAARANISLETLAEKLDDRFRILASGYRTALPRQQTMRATIDWSYGLLSVAEQRVFERLSVFAGGCELAAAAAVCGGDEVADDDVLDLLSSLVDKSLVVLDLEGSEPRYRLLESFREYAREKLTLRGEQDFVGHQHALASLALAERLDRTSLEGQDVFFPLARQELDNWRAALQWTLSDRGDVLLGLRIFAALSALWVNVTQVEGRRWLDCALQRVDERTPTSLLGAESYGGGHHARCRVL